MYSTMTRTRVKEKPKKFGTIILTILYFLQITPISEAYWIQLAKYIPNFQPPSWIMYQSPLNGRRYPSNTVGIIQANGYPVETHLVVTEDGYILELHRIPPSNNNIRNLNNGQNPLPVLLMHGNFQSSADWVINSPANNSFAFILSNSGHDVWLGNHRGNAYSKSHTKFRLNSHEFWDFSFEEMGRYDVPAMVDYILSHTGHSKLHYGSFSYSTTAFIAGLSLRPEYNAKIATGILMGPSVYQIHFLNGLLYYFAFSAKIVDAILNTFGAFPIMPHFLAGIIHTFLPIFCNPKLDLVGICVNVERLFFGNGNLISKEQIPLITSVAPSSSGLKQWNHIVQLTGSLNFAQYDYGQVRNLARYGRAVPPNYNISGITAPIAIFYGGWDYLAHREDAKILADRLPNVLQLYKVPYERFTHLDFSYGRDQAADVYYHAIHIMRRQEEEEVYSAI